MDEMIPAPCQGILAVECREDDEEIVSLLSMISVEKAKARFERERELFLSLTDDRSCSVPIGIYTEELKHTGDEQPQIRLALRYRDVRAVRNCALSEFTEVSREMVSGVSA